MLASASIPELREGIAAAKAGEVELGRTKIRQAAEAQPSNDLAWMWLARLAPTPDQAMECLQRVLASNPDHPLARAALPAIRLQAAIAAAKLGERERARSLLNDLVADEPNNEIAWLWLAHVADCLESAIACLERVLELKPNHRNARNALAHFRSLLPAANECPLCLHRQKERIERCPGCGALFNYADFDAAVENRDVHFPLIRQAVARLCARVRNGDDDPGLRTALGWALLNVGDVESAIEWFQRATELLPDDRQLKLFLHQLRRRKKELELRATPQIDSAPVTQVLTRHGSGEAERRRQAARAAAHQAESDSFLDLLPSFVPPAWDEPNYHDGFGPEEPLPKTEEIRMRGDRKGDASTKEFVLPAAPAIAVRVPPFMQCWLNVETPMQVEVLNIGDRPIPGGEAKLRLNASWALVSAADASVDPNTRMLHWKIPTLASGKSHVLRMTILPALPGQYQQEVVATVEGVDFRQKTRIRNDASPRSGGIMRM